MNRTATILVIEDDLPIRRGLVDGLRFAGHHVLEAADGPSGLHTAQTAATDLVLLDVMLPKQNGFDVLAKLRKTHPDLPVILLTARGTEADRLQGFRRGADDYVTKPFSVAELHARIQAVLRRSKHIAQPTETLQHGCLQIDFNRQEIQHTPTGQTVSLTVQETKCLQTLTNHRDTVVAKNQLLQTVLGIDITAGETRALDMLVARLRDKLNQLEPNAGQLIQTVRGRGLKIANTPVPGSGQTSDSNQAHQNVSAPIPKDVSGAPSGGGGPS